MGFASAEAEMWITAEEPVACTLGYSRKSELTIPNQSETFLAVAALMATALHTPTLGMSIPT